MKRFSLLLLCAAILWCGTASAQKVSSKDSGTSYSTGAWNQFRGFRFSPGVGLGSYIWGQDSARGTFEIGLGGDTAEQVYIGGGIQLMLPLVEEPDATLGAFFENRFYFPSSHDISFVLRDRVYASIETEHEVFNVGIAIMPGIMMRLSPGCDVIFNAGYRFGFDPTEKSVVQHGIVFQSTFDLHRKVSTFNANGRREVPYYSSGIEIGGGVALGLEIDPDNADSDPDGVFGLCLSLGYRINPQLSVGLELAPISRRFYAPNGNYHNELYSEMGPLAVTGRYRLLDKTFSPVATISLGVAAPSGGMTDKTTLALLFSPRIGASWRLGAGNGHLELCGGLGTGATLPFRYTSPGKAQIYTLVRPEFTLRYYHTLKWGSNMFKK